jgi:hypothetical protein
MNKTIYRALFTALRFTVPSPQGIRRPISATRASLLLGLILLLIALPTLAGCERQAPIVEVVEEPAACPPCPGAAYDTSSTTTFTNLAATGTLAISGNSTLGGTLGVTGATTLAALTATGASDLQGNLSDSGGAFTIADNTMIDGAADAIQFTVQGNSSQTNNLIVAEDSNGTDKFTVSYTGNVYSAGTVRALQALSAITANWTAQAANSGTLFVTTNAITLTLPAAATGLTYCLFNGDGNDVYIDPASGDQIHTLTNAAGDRVSNTTVGDSICLVALDGTYWLALERVGTWADAD